MLRLGSGLRAAAEGAPTFEDAARQIVRHIHGIFRSDDGRPECALVRFYRTHRYDRLGAELQQCARSLLGDTAPPGDMRCLTLMATAGERTEWNDRHRSMGHRAIPLSSPELVERAPMVAHLIRQLGIDIQSVVRPSPQLHGALEGKMYNIVYVEQARGSPYIPAQVDFVSRYGIESVLGFGGRASEELFAIILFSTVSIPVDVAMRFRNVPLDVKSALIGYREDEIFDPAPVAGGPAE